MNRLTKQTTVRLAVLAAIALAGPVLATSYTWTPTAAGTYNWDDATSNWTSGFPNNAADTANVTVALAGAQTIDLNEALNLNILNVGATGGLYSSLIEAGTGGSLTFGGGGTPALNQSSTSFGDTISAPISLTSNMIFANSSTAKPLTISGNISSTAAVTLDIGNYNANTGAGMVILSGTNSYTGTTRVDSGTTAGATLRLTNASAAGTSTILLGINNNAILQLYSDGSTNFGNNFGTVANNNFTVLVADAAGDAATGFTHTLGNLAIASGTMTVSGGASGGYGLTINNITSTGGSNIQNNLLAGILTINNIVGDSAGVAFIFKASNNANKAVVNGVISDFSPSNPLPFQIGGGNVTLNGSNTYTGPNQLYGGVLNVSSDANLGLGTGATNIDCKKGTLNVTSPFVLNAARGINLANAASNNLYLTGQTLTFNGTITGTNELDIGTAATGGTSGSLILGGTSTGYSGLVRILGGSTLTLTSSKGAGTGLITLSSGSTLKLLNDTSTNFGNNFAGYGNYNYTITAADAAGDSTTGGTHTLGNFTTTNNSVTFTGAYGLTMNDLTLNANPLSFVNNLVGPLTVHNILGPNNATYNLSLGGSGSMVVNGVVSDFSSAFPFTIKITGGKLTLNGNNTYTGNNLLQGGSVVVSSDANLGLGTGTGNLDFSTGTLTATATFELNAARGMKFVNNKGALQVATSQTLTYNGTITGTKECDIGSTTLTGINGTLVLGGSSSSFSGPVVVSDCATDPGTSTLRLTSAQALGTSVINMGASTALVLTSAAAGSSNTMTFYTNSVFNLLSDGSTNFGNKFGALGNNNFTVHVGDAADDGATGNTHTLGNLTLYTGTMFVTGGYGLTVGNLTSSGNSTINNSASGLLTIHNAVGNQYSLPLIVQGSGNTTITGVISDLPTYHNGITKQDGGTLTLTGTNTYTGGTTVSGGELDAAMLPNNTALTVAAGTTFKLTGGSAHTFTTLSSLTVTTGAHLDFAGNDLLALGAAAGLLTVSTSITTVGTPSGSSPYVTTGVMTGDVWTALYGAGSFHGATPTSADLVLKYVYAGDADMDGKITAQDFAQLDANYLKGTYAVSGASWLQGDFNHDGKIDAADFALIDFNFGLQSPGGLAAAIIAGDAARFGSSFTSALASLSAGTVPEPASLGLLALGALGLLGRRRR